MFTYYFYNSFTLGNGFTEVEYKDGLCLPPANLLPEIKCDFYNGGVEIILRKARGYGYFMVKGINYVNLTKRVDEQGRKVFINFAIQCRDNDYDALCQLAANYISDRSYINEYIGNLFIIPFDNNYRYTIEAERWNRLVKYMSESPVQNRSRIVRMITSSHIDDIRFIACTRDYEYYEEQASFLNKAIKVTPVQLSAVGVKIVNSSLSSQIPVRIYDKNIGDSEEYDSFVSKIEDFPSSKDVINKAEQSLEGTDFNESVETAKRHKRQDSYGISNIMVKDENPQNSDFISILNKNKGLMGAIVVLLILIFGISKCNSSKADVNHGEDSSEQVGK